LRFLLPIAVVVASVAVSVAVSLRPSPAPEVPSGRAAVSDARTWPTPGPASGASHGVSRPEDPPEPRPGDPWPAAREEEGRYLELHSYRYSGGTTLSRNMIGKLSRQADVAFRYVRGDYGTAPDVWSSFSREHRLRIDAPGPVYLEALTAVAPESSFTASFDEYAAIRGGRYFADPKHHDGYGDHKYDPETEIPGFTAWIERYPGHPGLDDACYRLGRCFGIRGDGRRALDWFRRAQEVPDGDMRDDARCWEILLLDALLTMDELRAEASTGDAKAMYSLGVRLFRRGETGEAARLIRAALPGLPGNLEADPGGQLRGVLQIARLVRRGNLYAVGRRQYGDFDLYENLLWENARWHTLCREGVLWGWGHDGAPEAFREEWRLSSNRLQARASFLAFLDTDHDPDWTAKARFSATTALGHTQGGHFEQRTVICPHEVRIQLAGEYADIARDFPESSLADDALVFSGLYSGDRDRFSEAMTRYPNGDMRGRAEREYRRATERGPPSVERLAEWMGLVAAKGDDRWEVSGTLSQLDRWLTICTARISWLRGEERKREIGKLVRWFRDVRGKLEFDRTLGVYVVR